MGMFSEIANEIPENDNKEIGFKDRAFKKMKITKYKDTRFLDEFIDIDEEGDPKEIVLLKKMVTQWADGSLSASDLPKLEALVMLIELKRKPIDE